MKKVVYSAWLAIALFTFSCKSDLQNEMNDIPTGPALVEKEVKVELPSNPLTKTEVDDAVKAVLQRDHDFHWEWVNPEVVWSAIHYGDSTVAIGYKPASLNTIDDQIHLIDVKSGEWKRVHDEIIETILSTLNSNRASNKVELKDILIEDDETLPILTFKLVDRATIEKLMNLENIRYIEPLDYKLEEDEQRSSSGCDPSTYALNSSDYFLNPPNCYVPWSYFNMNIPTAWNTSQGAGVTIGVIDAGISSSQPLLGSQFGSGYSNNGRTISTSYTLGNSAYTSCSHGTSMCGLAAGPRNSSYSTTGVAYKSNLHFVRACNDVVLDGSAERTGVKNALVLLGNNTNVKIISMSIGTPFSSGVLQDGLNYAYGMGKIVMAAAGTSFSWTAWWGVIYPAAYSNCVAITGVNESSQTCADCHDGSEVDYTVVMERNANDNRNTLTIPTSGNYPAYIGGSSAATATAAGIAALVWSNKPYMTRDQVMNCLKTTSQYYPTKDWDTGYGNLNASAAVAASNSY